ncbi:hypothetical protein ABIB42_003659 [Massilia sp. UYP32]|uniref:hypothetical protein n=1 Tax=Massilia sp. UYP32 TaxID=1756386 RepID=UPI003D1BB7E6
MKFIILVLALLYGSEVMACSLDPRVYDLKAFLAKSKNGDVVFTGRVVSVTTSEDGKAHRITVKAERWWRGHPRENVVVLGRTGTMLGTSCEGVFDFSPPVDSTVLIVGEERGAEIHALLPISGKIDTEQLPQELKDSR